MLRKKIFTLEPSKHDMTQKVAVMNYFTKLMKDIGFGVLGSPEHMHRLSQSETLDDQDKLATLLPNFCVNQFTCTITILYNKK